MCLTFTQLVLGSLAAVAFAVKGAHCEARRLVKNENEPFQERRIPYFKTAKPEVHGATVVHGQRTEWSRRSTQQA